MKVIVSQELTYQYVKERFAEIGFTFSRLFTAYQYYLRFSRSRFCKGINKALDFESFCVQYYLTCYDLFFRDYRELKDELL